MKREYEVREGEPKDGAGAPAPLPGVAQPRTISIDALPEEMKDMSEAEIKFYMSRTLSGMGRVNDENKELRRRVDEMERIVKAPPPPEKDPNEDKPLNELVLEDAEAAILRVAKKHGLIRAIDDVSAQTAENTFDTVASRMGPDFAEHEDEVRKALKEAGAPVNKKSIELAYDMVLGRKLREGRALEARKAANPDKPKATPPEAGKTLPEETSLEKEIREAHGKTREEWERYKNDEVEIKLPMGRK